MKYLKRIIVQQQMDDLIQSYVSGKNHVQTQQGWIQSIRLALGMSLRQLAEKIGVSASALNHFEKREQTEAITLSTLKKAAEAMDMDLVYYFKPKNGTIKNTIAKQAQLKALEILNQSNQTMKLEDQETNYLNQQTELERLTNEFIAKMPNYLWD